MLVIFFLWFAMRRFAPGQASSKSDFGVTNRGRGRPQGSFDLLF